ncbi:hypothetical protein [Adoxophyes orana nucleopolyhedrovirus]|uniref:hypothetical protein n=1 Tax=Adoxophyes orana nucleopolyhedrovirus TaxID=542343 RepID=UPI0001829BE0|nr:hypothetical protein [Adoxophyes orana nucleopolyhedrovirus]ACF05307.1 hypothetical protein [Adoxophyes orana nucleopolyhedrovirus]
MFADNRSQCRHQVYEIIVYSYDATFNFSAHIIRFGRVNDNKYGTVARFCFNFMQPTYTNFYNNPLYYIIYLNISNHVCHLAILKLNEG